MLHAWLSLFPYTKVFHLPRICSYHTPLILHTQNYHKQHVPFRLKAMWLADYTFVNLVQQSWKPDLSYVFCTKQFQYHATTWNSTHLGNIVSYKKKLLARLKEVLIFLYLVILVLFYLSCGLILLQSILKFCKMRQISRNSNLDYRGCNLGIKILVFFQSNTLARRRKNKIFGIKDENHNWLFNPFQIQSHILDYF